MKNILGRFITVNAIAGVVIGSQAIALGQEIVTVKSLTHDQKEFLSSMYNGLEKYNNSMRSKVSETSMLAEGKQTCKFLKDGVTWAELKERQSSISYIDAIRLTVMEQLDVVTYHNFVAISAVYHLCPELKPSGL